MQNNCYRIIYELRLKCSCFTSLKRKTKKKNICHVRDRIGRFIGILSTKNNRSFDCIASEGSICSFSILEQFSIRYSTISLDFVPFFRFNFTNNHHQHHTHNVSNIAQVLGLRVDACAPMCILLYAKLTFERSKFDGKQFSPPKIETTNKQEKIRTPPPTTTAAPNM